MAILTAPELGRPPRRRYFYCGNDLKLRLLSVNRHPKRALTHSRCSSTTGGLRWSKEAGTKQVEMSSAIHLALDQPSACSGPFRNCWPAWGRSPATPLLCRSAWPRPLPVSRSPRWWVPGPFTFAADQWLPGQRAVCLRNARYVARDEPPSGSAGGKVAHVDRVGWMVISDLATSAAAMASGEVDWWGYPTPDLVPVVAQGAWGDGRAQ